MAVELVRGHETLAQLAAFFRVFELSCFRDPPGDSALRELKMKTNHENAKVRKQEKRKENLIELNRTRVKSREPG